MQQNSKTTSLLTRIIKWHCQSRYQAWQLALDNPAVTQYRLLKEIIHACAHTRYARFHKLDKDDGIKAFQSKIPIINYDEVSSWFDNEDRKSDAVIVPSPILQSLRTHSGKRVPYNKALCGSFFSMYQIWMYDIICNYLKLETGKIFIFPSLLLREVRQYNRLQVPHWARHLLYRYSITPHDFQKIEKREQLFDLLACLTLSSVNLEVIALNHPDDFLQLLDHIYLHRERLIPILQKGKLTTSTVTFRFTKLSHTRCNIINATPIPWTVLWPKLKLISCWNSAGAEYSGEQLAQEFPDVYVQGKGLITKEAPLSVPIHNGLGTVPLLDELFYEFEDEFGKIHLLQELRPERDYNIIISQKGGLLRYRVGEKIKTLRNYRRTPCFEYLGQSDQVSDLAGEKIHARFVKDTLHQAFSKKYIYLLLPIGDKKNYCLLTDNPKITAEQADAALCHSRNYRQARMFGRLNALEINFHANLKVMLTHYCQQHSASVTDLLQSFVIATTKKAEHLLAYLSTAKHIELQQMRQIDFIQ